MTGILYFGDLVKHHGATVQVGEIRDVPVFDIDGISTGIPSFQAAIDKDKPCMSAVAERKFETAGTRFLVDECIRYGAGGFRRAEYRILRCRHVSVPQS